MGKLYIAYGSNLNLNQMALRCPTATIYSTGILNNWELIYRGLGETSHATIKKKYNSIVPVVIWDIQPKDEQKLDIYEGFPHYYYKQDIMVTINDKKRKAMVYIMNSFAKPRIPSRQYIEIIRQGYIDNNFDMKILNNSLYRNLLECK
jgi:gamma-glutamylcyclotransferase (GGCT)/AIG2-like uncharacterized protein YtfP